MAKLTTEIEARTGNMGFAKWRFQCFYDTFVQGSTFGILMNICAKNPPLRKAPKRYAQLKKSQPHKQHIWFLPTRKPTQKKPKELFFANAR